MSTQGFGGWYVVLYDSMQTDSWHYPSIEAAIADSSPILGSREYYCDYLTTPLSYTWPPDSACTQVIRSYSGEYAYCGDVNGNFLSNPSIDCRNCVSTYKINIHLSMKSNEISINIL